MADDSWILLFSAISAILLIAWSVVFLAALRFAFRQVKSQDQEPLRKEPTVKPGLEALRNDFSLVQKARNYTYLNHERVEALYAQLAQPDSVTTRNQSVVAGSARLAVAGAMPIQAGREKAQSETRETALETRYQPPMKCNVVIANLLAANAVTFGLDYFEPQYDAAKLATFLEKCRELEAMDLKPSSEWVEENTKRIKQDPKSIAAGILNRFVAASTRPEKYVLMRNRFDVKENGPSTVVLERSVRTDYPDAPFEIDPAISISIPRQGFDSSFMEMLGQAKQVNVTVFGTCGCVARRLVVVPVAVIH